MKTKKLFVSIIAGLTFMLSSFIPAQAFTFIPIDPLVPVFPLLSTPIYVNCSAGLDTNAGTTSAPVKTITKAVEIANAGTASSYQVSIAEGTCQNETYPIAVNAKDISFYGGYYNSFANRDPENHLTQIKGADDNMFEITNHSSTFSGLKLYSQTTGEAAIYIDLSGTGDNSVIVEGVEIGNTTAILGGINAIVESGDSLYISGNYLHNISSLGATIKIEGSASTSKIYNNFLYDNVGGFSGGIHAPNSYIYNNIISKTSSGAGIYLDVGSKAYNNTIVNGKNGLSMPNAVSGVEFKNNIVAYNSGTELNLAGTATHGNNAFFDNTTTHTLDSTDFSCDPKLANVNSSNTNDYKLGAGSDCIDKGTEISTVTKDYFGAARKKDGNKDAVYATDPGAHEADGDTAAAPSVTSNTASPNNFSPNADGVNDTTTISYNLNVTSNVIVAIYDGANIVKQLTNEVQQSGTHNVIWDGTNTGGTTMGEATYTYKISAQNSEGTNEKSGNITIQTGAVPPSELCSGFTDVAFDDPLCPAITYVKDQGIFQGYPDGTFRLYEIINRVETTKVVLEGFNIPLLADNGTNQGFNDVILGSWYMTYLRTGKSEGIIQGYPDGSFRPSQQVNRVEMLKIFLETSGEDLSGITVTTPPYPDTPINAWYIVYVQFSKLHALVDAATNGNFNPAEGMQRGDVADLFYRFHQEGLM